MIAGAISGGISIAVIIGLIYWVNKTFVSEKTCKARQDCLEGKIDALHELTKTEFCHIRELFKKLIDGRKDRRHS